MENNSAGLFQKAKDYAFLLLKFRLRSEREIYTRLKRKKFPEETISRTLNFLREKGFIDDGLFAKNWIALRLKRPFGLRKIEQELRIKGIGKEMIEQEIGAVKRQYCESDIVRKVAAERMLKLRGVEPATAKRRLYGYLLRRGFSSETVIDAITACETSSYKTRS